MRVAAIDIGTYSTRLLIGEDKQNKIIFSNREGIITNLGKDLFHKKKLSVDSMEKTLKVLRKFIKVCHQQKVDKIITVGTEALRIAENSASFKKNLLNLGLQLKILSSKDEAAYSFHANNNILNKTSPVIVIDQGGGSFEISYGKNNTLKNWISLKIGIVALKEKFLESNPPKSEKINSLKNYLKKEFSKVKTKFKNISKGTILIALGGTITSIAALEQNLIPYNEDKVHKYKLSKNTLNKWANILSKLSLSEINTFAALEKKRGEVILGGIISLIEILDTFGKDFFIVSEWGLRHGIILKELQEVL